MNNFLQEILNTFGDTIEVEEMDFSKKENVDKIVNAVNEIKNESNGLYSIVKTFIGEDVLNEVVKYAQQEYAKSHLDDEVKATTNVPAKTTPSRPSDNVSDEYKKQINKLATEYVDSMVKPYSTLTDEAYNNVKDGLFEFACWLMNR